MTDAAGRDPARSSRPPSPTPAVRFAHGDDKPGISNLIDILAVTTGRSAQRRSRRVRRAGYGPFKEDVAEAVSRSSRRSRSGTRSCVRGDEPELNRLIAVGAEKAAAVAEPTLSQMYERMGFVRLP